MTSRILPPDEWPRLAGTLLESAWPNFDPKRTIVIVVERDGAIVGCVAKLTVDHLEGVWITPSERGKVSVGRRLLRSARAVLGETQEVWMMAMNESSGTLCKKMGTATHLDCQHFAVQVTR